MKDSNAPCKTALEANSPAMELEKAWIESYIFSNKLDYHAIAICLYECGSSDVGFAYIYLVSDYSSKPRQPLLKEKENRTSGEASNLM
jgi:hypothetical protein